MMKQTSATSSPLAVTAIDCHAHVMQMDRPLSAERHSAPIRDVFVEEYIGLLDRHRISHGLLTQPSFYGSDNTLLLEALASQPERLRGTAIVEPTIDRATLDKLRQQGVCGIRLNWTKRASLPDVSTPAYQRLFAMVRDLDMHVEVFLEGELLGSVLPAIRKSRVNVVLDHFGCPDPATGVEGQGFQQVLKAVDAGDTWIKLSAPYRLRGADPQRYVDALLEVGGPHRLMWATDWPWVLHEDEVTYQQCIDWLTEWVPDDATRRIILADTPRKLFGY
jgi:predicted TIM-barrel fold metal-dependent hydrolase